MYSSKTDVNIKESTKIEETQQKPKNTFIQSGMGAIHAAHANYHSAKTSNNETKTFPMPIISLFPKICKLNLQTK